jgi:alcohol dehydrogenase
MGLQEQDIETLAGHALKDITTLTNPRQGTAEDIVNLYQAAS